MTLDIQIAGYQIKDEIGRGGMATVYRALQESLHRDVALKIMSPSLAADDGFKRRFNNEGHIIAQLSHSNIVTIFDIGNYQQYYYFSMEFLPGGTLRDKINQGLPLTEALEIAKILAKALGFAHQKNVIHRDIKPPNVLFRGDGSPVLTDFGIAKIPTEATQMTAAGYTFGSAGYMSPEQSLGNPLDHRSDLYSLGVLFWEMLTGNKPYNADNTFALAYKHATEPIPVLPDHLSGYQNILNQLLAKRPEDRFDTAEDFAIALETLQLELTPSGIQAQIDAADATQIRPSGVTPKTASSRTGEPEQTERRSNKMIIGLVAALVLLIGAAAVYFAIGKKSSPDPVVSDRQAPEQVPVTPSTTVSPVSPSPVGVTEPTSTITPPPDNTTTPEPVTATETPIVTMTPPDPTSTVEQPENNADQVIAVRYLQQVQRLLDEDAWEEGLEQIEAGLQEVPDNEELLALRSEMRALLSSESQEARKQRQINLGRLRLVKRSQETAQQLMQQGKLQESLQEIQKGLIIWPGDDSLLELRDEVEALIRKNE